METLQNHLQELASVTIDSEWLKDLVDLGSGAVKTVTGLTKAFGGLNTVIGAIAGILLQKSGFGLFSFDKLSGQWTSFIGKIKTSRKILQETKTGINNWMVNQGLSEDTQLSAIISADNPLGIGKQLDVMGMNAGLRDYIKNLDEATRSSMTLGQAIQSYYNSMSVGTKIAAGFGRVLGTLASTMGTMLISMAASALISKGIQLISDTIHAHENTIKAGNEASSEADQSRNEIKKINATTSAAEKRYNQLRKGVYMNGDIIQNLSLSSDEYAEFLNINEQLAETFPSLITGITDGGQSLVDLGENASEATQKLTELSDAAKQIHINDIKEEMPKIVSGLLEQNEDFDKSIQDSQKQIQGYQEVLDTLNSIDEQYTGGEGSFSVTINDKEARKSLEAYLDNANVDYTSMYDTIDFTFLSNEEYKRFSDSIKGYKNLVEGDIQGVQNQMKATESERQANWRKQFVPNLIEVLENDPNFLKMGDTMTNLITSKLPEFDWSSFFGGSSTYDSENAISDVVNRVIKPIELALDEGKVDPVDVSKVFNFDWDNATNEEITGKTNEVLQKLFPDEEIRQQVAVLLDIMYEDENGLHYTVTKERNDFYEMFGGKVTGYDPVTKTYTRDDSNARVTWAEIMSIGKEDRDFILGQADQGLVSLDTIKNYDELIAKIQELRQVQDELGTQTLADVLKDESFSDSASNIESKITALKTAMDSLMETGELKGDGLADLLETVPELKQLGDELTDDDISNAVVENIHDWIKLFDEVANSKDLSEDAKKAAQNYKKAVIQGFLEDTPITNAQAQKSIQDLFGDLVDLSGEPGEAKEKKYAHQITKANEVFESLQEEFGKDFDANIVEMIVDADPSMATATTEQWIATYKDYQVELKLTANAKELEQIESKIENLGSERGMLQSRISASESIGGIGSQADYDRIAEIDQETAGLNEDKVRKLSQKYQQMILGGRARGLMDNEDYLTTLRGVENELLTAQGDLAESYGQAAESHKDQITYSAREFQNEIDKRSELISSLEGVSEQYTNEGKIMDRVTAQSIVDAENANRQDYLRMAREYEALARNPENVAWATEFQAAALSARTSAMNIQRRTAEDLIDESRINFLGNSLTALEATATTIQDAITLQEGQGLKPTIDQYQRLVKNGQDQVANLEKQNYYLSRQQNRLTANSARWREIGAQINSNNSAIAAMNGNINNWQDNLRNFAGDMGQSLLSALQAAFDESNSPTGLQFGTMKELAAQFEGIEGFDFADIFYNTAQGVKLDADATERLVDAQYQLMTGDLTKRINSQNAALQNLRQTYRETTDASEKANLSMQIDAGEANLNNLYNQMAQYQALYSQAQRQLFSGYGEWQRALSSENAGAMYDAVQGGFEAFNKAGEAGEVGTDDFKTYLAMFDEWGRNTYAAYEDNKEKMKRYITDDYKGFVNLYDDLVKAGFGTKEGSNYNLDITDTARAAHALGISEEFLGYGLQKAEDYGLYNDFVQNRVDGELKLQETAHDTAEAYKHRNELIAEGASKEAIQEANDEIDRLTQRRQNLTGNIDDVVAREGKISAQEIEAGAKTIRDIREAMQHATTDGEKAEYQRMLQNVADEYGFGLDENNRIILPEEYKGYRHHLKDAKEVSKVTDEQIEGVKLEGESIENNETLQTGLGKLKNGWKANTDQVQKFVDTLKGANIDDLMALDLNDGNVVKGLEAEEAALDGLVSTFGLTADEAKLLVPILQELGVLGNETLYNKPGVHGALGVDVGAAQNYLDVNGFDATALDFDAASMSADELMVKMREISGMALRVDTSTEGGQEALDQLNELYAACQKEYDVKIKAEGALDELGMTAEQFLALDEATQKEYLANVGIDVDSSEYDSAIATIEGQAIQAKIEAALTNNSELTLEQLHAMGAEEIMTTIGCDASEVDAVQAKIEEMMANEYDMKVAINDASIREIGKSVAAALKGEEYKIPVTAQVTNIENNTKQPTISGVKITTNTSGLEVTNAIQQAVNNGTYTVTLGANTEEIPTAINSITGEEYELEFTGEQSISSIRKEAEGKFKSPLKVTADVEMNYGKRNNKTPKLETLKQNVETKESGSGIAGIAGILKSFATLKSQLTNLPQLNINTGNAQSELLKIYASYLRLKQNVAEPIELKVSGESIVVAIRQIMEGFETLRSQGEEAIELTVETGSAIESVNSLQEAIEEAKSAASGSIEVVADVKGKSDVDALRSAIEQTHGKTVAIAVSGVESSTAKIKTFAHMVQDIGGKTVNIGVSGVGNAILAVRNLQSVINGLSNKTVTITTNRVTRYSTIKDKNPATGTLSSVGHGYAKGTFDEDGKIAKSGSAYNMLNYKDISGYARGDVAIKEDQESLINELGTESIIYRM